MIIQPQNQKKKQPTKRNKEKKGRALHIDHRGGARKGNENREEKVLRIAQAGIDS